MTTVRPIILSADIPKLTSFKEVADNTYRDGSAELNNTEASFIKDGGVSVDQRKMNAVRAYFEWMPIRQVEMDDNLRIWRSFSIGSLLDLIMLDSKLYPLYPDDRQLTIQRDNTTAQSQIFIGTPTIFTLSQMMLGGP